MRKTGGVTSDRPFCFSSFQLPQLDITTCLHTAFQLIIIKRLTLFQRHSTCRPRTQRLLYLNSFTLLLSFQSSHTNTHTPAAATTRRHNASSAVTASTSKTSVSVDILQKKYSFGISFKFLENCPFFVRSRQNSFIKVQVFFTTKKIR